jgi:hypothetical protein
LTCQLQLTDGYFSLLHGWLCILYSDGCEPFL